MWCKFVSRPKYEKIPNRFGIPRSKIVTISFLKNLILNLTERNHKTLRRLLFTDYSNVLTHK